MLFPLPVAKSSRDVHSEGSDDEEDTLSLCEFSINSSSDSQSSSFKSSSTLTKEDDDDSSCFEFFSEEWSTDDHHHKSRSSIISNNNNNNMIIFCGKLIPSKEPVSQKTQKKTDKIESTSTKHKLAPLLTSSAQSKWYLYFFGITKFGTKMELRDIKGRQSRNSSRRSSSSHSDNEMMMMSSAKGGVWAVLLRTLSCGGTTGNHRNTDVIVRPLSAGSISKPSGQKSIARLLCMA